MKAQTKQKRQYDKRVCPTNSPVDVGDIVFVHMPALTTGEERKLNRTNQGPFRVTKVWTTGVEVVRLGRQKKSKPWRIALDRVRKCPEELVAAAGLKSSESSKSSLKSSKSPLESSRSPSESLDDTESLATASPNDPVRSPDSIDSESGLKGPWKGRLRARRGRSALGGRGVTSHVSTLNLLDTLGDHKPYPLDHKCPPSSHPPSP